MVQLTSFYDFSSRPAILQSLLIALVASSGSILQAWTGQFLVRRRPRSPDVADLVGGDCLGVLIATPLTLAFAGQPTNYWRPRRLTLGLSLLATLLLVALFFDFALDQLPPPDKTDGIFG